MSSLVLTPDGVHEVSKSPRWSCPLNSFKSAGETNLNQNEKKRYRCCITQISSKCLVPLNWETTLSPMTLWSGHRIVRQCCQVWLLRNTWHQKDDIKNNSDGVGIRVTWETSSRSHRPCSPLKVNVRNLNERHTNGTKTKNRMTWKKQMCWHANTVNVPRHNYHLSTKQHLCKKLNVFIDLIKTPPKTILFCS